MPRNVQFLKAASTWLPKAKFEVGIQKELGFIRRLSNDVAATLQASSAETARGKEWQERTSQPSWEESGEDGHQAHIHSVSHVFI